MLTLAGQITTAELLLLWFTKSVHTRLGHLGSPADLAILEPSQPVCTNVVWFDLEDRRV
jgi:hypothetical protein